MAYLSELHPEIYMTPPRPGGVANIVPVNPSLEHRLSTASRRGSKSIGDKTSMAGKASVRSTASGRGSIRSGLGSTFEASFLTSTPEKNSKEYRINQVLNSSRWMLPDLREDDVTQEVTTSITEVPNSITPLLGILISTIMVMASDSKKISKDHLKWTLSFLQCIKDDFGNNPPNVMGLINQIKLIDSSLESFLEEELNEGALDGTDGLISEEKPNTTTTTPT